jgi:hypothetical protein
MKTGRIQALGGIQYGSQEEVQGTALVGAKGPYTNTAAPTVSNVGEALDLLMGGDTSRYVEVTDTPYLIVRGGDYVCLPGSNTIYLSSSIALGDKVTITGVGLWVVMCNNPMRVGDKVGDSITSLEEGTSITLLMTSAGWITTHLLGNVDILLG